MKRALMLLGVVVVCLPMIFVLWLLAASHSPKMDASTRHMPVWMRSMVVQAMLGRHNDAASLQRAAKIDAPSVKQWQRQARLSRIGRPPQSLADIERRETLIKARGEKFNQMGLELEKAGNACAAEDAFTKAAGATSGGTVYAPVEHMGRNALWCGDVASARAGLETAVLKQGKLIEADDEAPDALKAAKIDMLKDREFLIVAYQRQHEKELTAQTCTAVHPGWKRCACSLSKGRDVTCVQQR